MRKSTKQSNPFQPFVHTHVGDLGGLGPNRRFGICCSGVLEEEVTEVLGRRRYERRSAVDGPPGSPTATASHRGAYGALVLRFTRLFAACGNADRRLGPAGTRTLVPLRGPAGPGRGGVCASSLRSGFVSRSKRRGRMGPAISCSPRWNCWRSWRLWSSRPGSISYATTGSWPPGPATATASCRPSRLPSRRRWTAMRALRPAAIGCGGRPCWRGCFRRPQRMRRLWRAPTDPRRPHRPACAAYCAAGRSGLDPDRTRPTSSSWGTTCPGKSWTPAISPSSRQSRCRWRRAWPPAWRRSSSLC